MLVHGFSIERKKVMSRYMVEDLFGINGINIAWYGVIIGFGMLLGG